MPVRLSTAGKQIDSLVGNGSKRMNSDQTSDSTLPMHPLHRALIEKAGHDNGFEYVLPGDAQHVALASAGTPHGCA